MALDRALPLDGDVGLDARDNSHVEVAEVLDLVLDLTPASRSRSRCSLRMLLAWRFSRTFASRFNFANVVFFLPAKVDLQVVPANRGPGRHDGAL